MADMIPVTIAEEVICEVINRLAGGPGGKLESIRNFGRHITKNATLDPELRAWARMRLGLTDAPSNDAP